jgi:hypothetical protein
MSTLGPRLSQLTEILQRSGIKINPSFSAAAMTGRRATPKSGFQRIYS